MTHENLHDHDTDTDPEIVSLLIQGRRGDVPDEAYADTVNKILYRLFDGDYISQAESDLCAILPELRGQPVVTEKYVSPDYLAFLLDHEIGLRHYPIIRKYLAIKIANLDPLSETEYALLPKFSDLDDFRAVSVAVTPELLARAAADPDAMDADAQHAITHYLTDKIIDEEPLTADEMQLLGLISPEGIEGIDAGMVGQDQIDAPRNQPDAASLEYGYDIYDYEALLKRLLEHLRATDEKAFAVTGDELPLDYREIRVIKRIWGFDPSDKDQLNAVFGDLERATDVLRPESRDEYIARKQRYRKPRATGFRESE